MRKPPGDSTAADSARKGAVFLSPEPPFPATGGGALRSASLFEYLSARYALDVITFRQPGAPDPREHFPPGKARSVHVIDLPYRSRSPMARAARNTGRALRNSPPLLDRFSGFEADIAAALGDRTYALGVIEHFWCAPYHAVLRPACERLILDLHNVESAWHGTVGAASGPLGRIVHRRFQAGYQSRERVLLPRFDCLLATSARDRARILDLAPQARTIVYPNALPTIARPVKAERDEIIFTGNLEYQPNISAVRYFSRHIWPRLHQRWPKLVWTVAGKNAHAVRSVLQGAPNIDLIGPMDDAVARIAQTKVAVVPLLSGSGTRIKILEAWAAATPVVSTSLGAEGLECVSNEHLMIAGEPRNFADAVSNLLDNSSERSRIGSAGRALYERCYTWERAWEHLRDISE